MRKDNAVEVHVGIDKYLDEVVKKLNVARFDVEYCGKAPIFIEVEGYKFYADNFGELGIEDEIYKTVVGQIRSDYLNNLKEKNIIANLKIEQKKEGIEKNVMCEVSLNYGKRAIYPEMHEEWEKFVTTYYFEQNEPVVVDGVVWLMKLFECGFSSEEAMHHLLLREDYCNGNLHSIALAFLNFHKRGPKIFEKLYGNNINSFAAKIVEEVRNRNLLFEKKASDKSLKSTKILETSKCITENRVGKQLLKKISGDNKITRQLHVGIDKYLDEVVEKLKDASSEATYWGKNHVIIEVGGHNFCTDEIDYFKIEDYVYNKTVGMSRNGYLLNLENLNQMANLKKEKNEINLEKIQDYKSAINYGRRVIIPQLHDEWEDFVKTYYFEKAQPEVIDGVVWLMNIFEFGVSIEKANHLFLQHQVHCEELQHTIPLCFLNFHEKGPDFVDKMYGENIEPIYAQVVSEKRARNLLFEKENKEFLTGNYNIIKKKRKNRYKSMNEY